MKLFRKIFEVDDKEMEKYRKEFTEGLGAPFAFKPLLREAAGVIAYEDLYPGTITQRFGQWYEEVIIVVKGKADIECSTPEAEGVWEKKTVAVEAGDCFFLYKGEQWSIKVTSEERLRYLCIIMPQQSYPPLPQR